MRFLIFSSPIRMKGMSRLFTFISLKKNLTMVLFSGTFAAQATRKICFLPPTENPVSVSSSRVSRSNTASVASNWSWPPSMEITTSTLVTPRLFMISSIMALRSFKQTNEVVRSSPSLFSFVYFVNLISLE